MENGTYTALTRQSGLMREMQVVANNIANLSTTGFRAE
ncbi:MAG: flagellar basal body protein, partial [Pseudomonadota bacterium]